MVLVIMKVKDICS